MLPANPEGLAAWRKFALLVLLAVGGFLPSFDIATAQAPCLQAAEPNEQPEQAMPIAGAFCVEGDIGQGDQEILGWTVSDEDAGNAWNVFLEGPAGVQDFASNSTASRRPATPPIPP